MCDFVYLRMLWFCVSGFWSILVECEEKECVGDEGSFGGGRKKKRGKKEEKKKKGSEKKCKKKGKS